VAIELGDAIWRFKGDPSVLNNDVNKASNNISNAMGKARKAVGVAMTAAGAAITGFAAKAIYDFASVGDMFHKMSQRTGVGVEELSRWKHVLEQSGTDLGAFERALRQVAKVTYESGEEAKMAGDKQVEAHGKASAAVRNAESALRNAIANRDAVQKAVDHGQVQRKAELQKAQDKVNKLGQKYNEVIAKSNQSVEAAGQVSGTYSDALRAIGLSHKDLADLSPEKQFEKIMFALSDLTDHTTKAALAGEIFGARIGTQMIPVMNNGAAGIRALMEESDALGLTWDQVSADSAAAFTDAMNAIKGGIGAVGRAVAVALMPDLLALTEWIKNALKDFTAWRAENSELFATIVKVTLGVGVLLSLLGPLLILMPGIAAAFGVVGTIAGAISVPLLALGAVFAVVAAAVYQAREWITQNWDQIVEVLRIGADNALLVLKLMATGFRMAFDVVAAMIKIFAKTIGDQFGEMTAVSWDENKTFLENLQTMAEWTNRILTTILGYVDAFLGHWGRFWDMVGNIADSGAWKALSAIAKIAGMANPVTAGFAAPSLVGGMLNSSAMPGGMQASTAPGGGGATPAALGSSNVFNLNFGRDSVRSDDDIREIERSISRVINGDLVAMGVRL
jgi:hypothetical protein